MAITAIARDWGNDSPAIVRILSTNTVEEVSTEGYILAQSSNIESVNNGAFTWLATDSILVACSDGTVLGTISSDFESIIPTVFTEAVVGLPVIVNRIATFASTGGNLKDNGAYSIVNDLLLQPSEAGITAHPGGGQASATQLTAAINSVKFIATAGDSVKLPPATAGSAIMVININDTTAMQVFGQGSDEINLVASATGISQLPDTTIVYTCVVDGFWTTSIVSTNFPLNTLLPYSASLTAHAGGGKASALQLVAYYNVVTTVATAGDSVKLPPAVPGTQITLINLNDTNAIQVFGNGTDTINLVDTAVGISQLQGTTIVYGCSATGNWHTDLVSDVATVPTLAPFNGDVTPHAGGGSGSAVLISAELNTVKTIGTSGDSIKLPPALINGISPLVITVENINDDKYITVFPSGSDQINLAVSVNQLADTTITYTCTADGFWVTSSVSNNYPINQANTLIATVAITAAQFNGMYAAPKLLVAAPGANQLLVLDKVELIMTYGSANYAAGGVAAVQYDSTANGAGVIASTTLSAATFQAAASTTFPFQAGVVPLPFTTTVNKGLYLSNITGAFTTGDSTFVAKVFYKIVPTV